MADRKIRAKFVEPMLLLRTDKLPEGEKWAYEIKLDGTGRSELRPTGKSISAPAMTMILAFAIRVSQKLSRHFQMKPLLTAKWSP
jgi:hypothetical protein